MSRAGHAPVLSDRHTSDAYAELKHRLEVLGLFRPQTRYYIAKTALVLALFAVGLTVALLFQHPGVVLGAAALLGIANVRAEMLGHDIGHRQLLRSPRSSHIVGLLLGNLLLGISYTQWITKHNRHHAYPNHVSKDPDGHYAVLALSREELATGHPLLRPLIAFQAFLFPFWLLFQPIFMRVSAFLHLRQEHAPHRVSQTLALVVHFALYGILLTQVGNWGIALAFVAIHQGIMGIYNGLVFAPNHKGMTMVNDDSEMDFLERQVLTARNVRGKSLVDLYFGGLNYQIEHHLFPAMPRNQLRRAQPLVKDFCRAHGVSYYETSFLGSYVELFRHLHAVSSPLRKFPWRAAQLTSSKQSADA